MITRPRVLGKIQEKLFNRWKPETFAYIILSLLIIAIWLPRLRGPIDLRWDGTVYYILGTSIAEGKGYRLLNEPGEIQAIQYPPMLPLIVAAHQWVIGSSDPFIVGPWLRFSSFGFFFAYILTSHAVLRQYLPLKIAFVGTVICLFQMHTYFMSDLLFPEVLYGLATTSFVLVSQRNHTRASTVMSALLVMGAFGLRTVGIALLGAWIAESLFNRKYRSASVRLAVAFVSVFCWQSYIMSVVTGAEYDRPAYAYQRAAYMFHNVSYANNIFSLKDSFAPELGPASLRDLTIRVLFNFTYIPQELGEAVSSPRESYEKPWALYKLPIPFSSPWPVDVALVILGCLVIGGIALYLTRQQWLLPTYVILSIASMCLTPWPWQFNRYLMPLTPFLVLFMMSTLLTVIHSQGRWRIIGRFFTQLTVSLILLLQFATFAVTYSRLHQSVTYRDLQGRSVHYRLFFYRDAYRALDAGIDWLQVHARAGEVLAGVMPDWMYLRTGLKAVMPPFETDPVKAQTLLDSVPVTYLCLEDGLGLGFETKRYMAQVVQKFPERWERVYVDTIARDPEQSQDGEFAIYRRIGSLPPRHDLTQTPAMP